MGACKIKVNHINRNQRYIICRQDYPELCLGILLCLGNHKNINNYFDNQELVAQFLWDIGMIRINSGFES